MKKILDIIMLVACLGLILVGIYGIYDTLVNTELGVKEVECFDKYGNMIEGLICEKETTTQDQIMLSGFFFLAIIIGGVLFTGTLINLKEKGF